MNPPPTPSIIFSASPLRGAVCRACAFSAAHTLCWCVHILRLIPPLPPCLTSIAVCHLVVAAFKRPRTRCARAARVTAHYRMPLCTAVLPLPAPRAFQLRIYYMRAAFPPRIFCAARGARFSARGSFARAASPAFRFFLSRTLQQAYAAPAAWTRRRVRTAFGERRHGVVTFAFSCALPPATTSRFVRCCWATGSRVPKTA